MEKYNSEELISTLLIAGFNKVDQLLITLVIDKIKKDEKINKILSFDNDNFYSNQFSEYVSFEDFVYYINGSSPRNIAYYNKDNKEVLIGDLLLINKTLLNYILEDGLKDVIIKKAKLIGIEDLSIHVDLFSNKEINIIKEEYGNEVFGDLYNTDMKFKYDDFKNISDEELVNIMKNYTGCNYIYHYLLTDRQKIIAKNAMNNNAKSYNFEDNEDIILNNIRTRDRNESALFSVIDAISRQ